MFFLLDDYVLLTLLLLSLYFDLAKKKIPNFLTFPVIFWGLFINTVTGGFEGLQFSFYGLLLGLSLFLIPFLLGGMGGGDVKLLGAIGALKGAHFVFQAALFTALCGGVLAIVYLAFSGRLLRAFKKILAIAAVPLLTALYIKYGHSYIKKLVLYFSDSRGDKAEDEKKIYLPYGVAIAFGTLIVMSSPGGMLLGTAFQF